MTEVAEKEGVYLASFKRMEELPAAGAPSWLHEIRKEAMDCFAEKGFPTTRMEEWRNTNLAQLAAIPFERPSRVQEKLAEQISRYPLADLGCPRLVFIDGRFSSQLSALKSLPKGVRVGNLAEAIARDGKFLEAHLTRHAADYKDHALVALNTAFIEDGAFVEISKGTILEKPLCLLYLSTTAESPVVTYPRNLVILGQESQAAIIEGYLGFGAASSRQAPSFTNTVTEVAAGEGAILQYHRIQQQRDVAFHFARLQIYQERSSSVTVHSVTFGGGLVRDEVKAVLDGEGAEATLNGLYVVTGHQHVDNQTTLDHAKPHCSSREVYKGVLDEKSSAVFNGKIIVRKDAQRTDSKQSNKNLLLSEKAVIDTKPALEIYADDVKCTHGATVGQIDPEAVFYLRSRGIGKEEARDLLTYAFANDILEGIKHKPLQEQLRETLSTRLAGSRQKQEA